MKILKIIIILGAVRAVDEFGVDLMDCESCFGNSVKSSFCMPFESFTGVNIEGSL